jgi:TRAP-type C4-dicarboxylate transport system permease small subunit
MASLFKTLDKIKPVYDWAYKIVLFICKILLVGDILITCMSVLGRYISFIPDLAWTEEVVLTFMSYMAVLSAALAIRRGAHIRMTAFDIYLPNGLIKALDILADICVFVLGIIMVVVGWRYASTIGAKGTYVSMPKVSRFWMYFPIPVAGVAMVIFEIEALYNDLKGIFIKEGKCPKTEGVDFMKRKNVAIIVFIVLLFIGVMFCIVLKLNGTGETEPEYVFFYAENQTSDYPTTLGGLEFARLVEEKTAGRIKIIVADNAEFGSESEVIDQISYGGIAFARISISTLAEIIPQMNVLQLPYLYNDSDHMWRVLDGEIGDSFLAMTLEYDLLGLLL